MRERTLRGAMRRIAIRRRDEIHRVVHRAGYCLSRYGRRVGLFIIKSIISLVQNRDL